METTEVTLPTGFAVGRRWYRSAVLHALTGVDEEFIGAGGFTSPVNRAAALLVACLIRLGPKTAVEPADVLSLSVGDRDALLLQLRRLTFGDRIPAVLACPTANCGAKMDLDLSVKALLVSPNGKARAVHSSRVKSGGADYEIQFRLPTGADQVRVSELARKDLAAASEQLLRGCIRTVKTNGAQARAGVRIPSSVTEAMGHRMAELDPQAEILLELKCPTCGQDFRALFDITEFLFKELRPNREQLYREVHALALYYHWSERDILNMSRTRRQIYLRMLDDSLNPEERP